MCSSQDMNSYLGWTNEDAEVQTDQMTCLYQTKEYGNLGLLTSCPVLPLWHLISAANENDRVQGAGVVGIGLVHPAAFVSVSFVYLLPRLN